MLTFQTLFTFIFGGQVFPIRGPAIVYVFWALREALWWAVFTLLASLLFAFVRSSPSFADFRGLVSRGA